MKTIEEIYDEMLSVFRTETGAEASAVSDLSVRLYAVAAQIYGLYAQVDWLSKQCFPQTAQAGWLDRHAALRGLERREAMRAEGNIRFSVSAPAVADLDIPSGTVCATAGMIRFETTAGVTLKAGETSVLAPARAVEPGEGGNVPAGSILAMAVPPVGVGACVNPEAFTGGAAAEDDDALRVRVLETYRRMPNGANAAFYEQAALSFPEVAACAVLPRNRGQGTVDVVITSAAGAPSEELIAEVQEYFEQRREIAVDVLVKGPNITAVDIRVSVTAEPGADKEQVKADVRAALEGLFTGALLGQGVPLPRLIQLVYSQKGVKTCKILSPGRDMSASAGVLYAMKSLVVEAI